MRYFPLNLDIAGKKALVAGGGQVALRKVERLLECGADVTVVSPVFCRELARMKRIKRVKRTYRKTDMKGAVLVISATDSVAANKRVYEHATEAGIPVNVVDQPHLCTFTVPAVISRGELLVTVSTGGGSPALSARIRRHLEQHIDDSFVDHLELLTGMRPIVRSSGLSEAARGELMKKMAGDRVSKVLKKSGTVAARRLLDKMLTDAQK
jgi:precorrin-2 dehydrogenase/sirohydrochlorin ferrochelatase